MQIAEHFVGILAMGVIQTILWVNATAALEAIAKRWARAAPAPPGGPIGDASAGRSLCRNLTKLPSPLGQDEAREVLP